MEEMGITKLHHLGTSGMSLLLRDTVNNLDDEGFQAWMDYHLMTCEEPSILGYSMHGLYIGKK